ncbi:hypothetical protein B0H15DRAFT_956364 [Mycena belliarum]|uniref:Uncharacterized protein n=1 Tax=Mycena belliarum TaxID=1033014 RepID=A0AAD6XJE2_9AGAR|nr:hypothetical protein B0H15DRAFT_956364 [Mycena belliae]
MSSTDAKFKNQQPEPALDFKLARDADKLTRAAPTSPEANRMSAHTLKLLCTKKAQAPSCLADQVDDDIAAPGNSPGCLCGHCKQAANASRRRSTQTGSSSSAPGALHPPDAPDGRVRFRENNRLDRAGRTYLAPLTIVGNPVRAYLPAKAAGVN